MTGEIKAVIADVDGTLYDLRPVRRQMARRLARFALGRPRLGCKTIRALRAFRKTQERLRQMPSYSATDQFLLAGRLSGYDSDFIQTAVARWMEQEPLDAISQARFEGVTEFFDWARTRDLALAAVSDYDPRQKLRAMGLDSRLQACVWAQQAEVQWFKPHPRGLLLAARKLGVVPSEAVYIGDRQDVDVAAAQSAGMRAVLLRPGTLGDDSTGSGFDIATSWHHLKELLEPAVQRRHAAVLSGKDELFHG